MLSKQQIIKKYNITEQYYADWTLSEYITFPELMQEIDKFCQRHQLKKEDLYFTIRCGYENGELVLNGRRDKTDEEFMKAFNECVKQEEKLEAAKLEEERKLYENLKKKFEDK